jgi:membrane protease YdiL (CAAX protease family)
MKKCSYCGKEYPDSAAECPIDRMPLTGGERQDPPVGEEIAVAAAPAPLSPLLSVPAAPIPTAPWTDRQIRVIEILLVCAVAFGSSILVSTFHFLGLGFAVRGGIPRWVVSIFQETAALGLLWYVLMRRSRCFSDLGFSWAKKDVGWSVLVWLGGTVAFCSVYAALRLAGLTSVSQTAASSRVGHFLFAGGVSLVTLLFAVLNPFFEELIARAYVMTEVKQLTNSTSKAIIVSTALQMSYHFYQGSPMAFAEGASFLAWSIFYARTQRITPVILAHLYNDVGGTLWFVFFH